MQPLHTELVFGMIKRWVLISSFGYNQSAMLRSKTLFIFKHKIDPLITATLQTVLTVPSTISLITEGE